MLQDRVADWPGNTAACPGVMAEEGMVNFPRGWALTDFIARRLETYKYNYIFIFIFYCFTICHVQPLN